VRVEEWGWGRGVLTDNVLPFTVYTAEPAVDPDSVLEGQKGKLKDVFVIGYDQNGYLICASSSGYLPDLLWLLERARREVNRQADL
jgi:hypothetical protein